MTPSLGWDQCCGIINENMQRLRPSGVTRIGHYIQHLRAILRKRHPQGTIVDFGCGPWIDLSAALAMGCDYEILLVEPNVQCLDFAVWRLRQRGLHCHGYLPGVDTTSELELAGIEAAQPVMIVESSAFEHVREIRWMFPRLMELLPPQGLFLTNYTALDWRRPELDGFAEAKSFASDAVQYALTLADRWEWELVDGGGAWDLWERRS